MTGSTGVFIIAEAGVNHNGSLDNAYKLVDIAAAARADAVKFQTWKTEDIITREAPKAPYQLLTTGEGESQYDMLKKLELSFQDFANVKDYCDLRQILFLSTADEIASARFLNALVPLFKIGSAELTNLPFLREIAHFGKPVILSTGMGTMEEIGLAIQTLQKAGLSKGAITVLHCTTAYPTPCDEVNLLAMLAIRETFQVPVGYSDHTLGIEIPMAAAALGASIIEKHFTLDRSMQGPDHALSLEAPELEAMVRGIRNVERALGSREKRPSESERINMPSVRKSIVAARKISRGDLLTEENLTVKRPGTGMSPALWDSVIGTKACRDFQENEMIVMDNRH
jgi:N,N'-diacetyllegionaminate synthase